MDAWQRLGSNVFRFAEGANSYLIRSVDGGGVVIDPGYGSWWPLLADIGVKRIDAMFVTHLHRDLVCGLYRDTLMARQFRGDIFLPAGDADLATASGLDEFWHTYQDAGCPRSYAAPCRSLPRRIHSVSADSEHQVGEVRLCALATPGHSPGALSYIMRRGQRQIAFCGDAAHAGATLHQLYHLEWDHWTPAGALSAWYGLERLRGNRIDLLLPSHGPVVRRQPRQMLQRLQTKLLRFISAKSAIAADQPSRWIDTQPVSNEGSGKDASDAHDVRRILPHLYAFGDNGYLLAHESGGALIVDPQQADLPALEALLQATGLRPQVVTASHYHVDHSDALDDVRQHYGAEVWLHPWVAEPLRDHNRYDVPWLPATSIVADRLLPREGRFRWGPYAFDIRPYPGQTWWHCAFDTVVDGHHVLFSGDNFQPPSRWNGTGGFCAFNGSRFIDGFARSARAGIDINPEIICNGHGCLYHFDADHHHAILAWCEQAETAVADLCPQTHRGADWLADYDLRAVRFDPFILPLHAGQRQLVKIVIDNHTRKTMAGGVAIHGFDGMTVTPRQRRLRLPPKTTRRAGFELRLPHHLPPGRYPIAADVVIDGVMNREACVALVDVPTPAKAVPRRRKKNRAS